MRSLSMVCLTSFALLATWAGRGSAAELPLSPAAAERLLDRSTEVTSEFRQLIQRAGDSADENLAALADTGSPDWRLYYRDRQLMFAVPTRRNLTAAQKKIGEQDAAELAAVMLQQQFQESLRLQAGNGLDSASVRVVFIEPAAHAIAAGAWGGGGTGPAGYGGRPCGMPGTHGGFAGTPLPFAPAGWWPGVGSGNGGGCGCR
jgi:hypothetical protein